MSNNAIIFLEKSNQFDVTVDYISKVLQSHNSLKRRPTNLIRRDNLSLADTMRLIHQVEANKFNTLQVARLFFIRRKNVFTIWKDRTHLVAREKSTPCSFVKRPLNSNYLQIDARVHYSVQYVCSQHC